MPSPATASSTPSRSARGARLLRRTAARPLGTRSAGRRGAALALAATAAAGALVGSASTAAATPATPAAAPVVASTATGPGGYQVVTDAGQVASFGAAALAAATPGGAPAVGTAGSPDGAGMWTVASNGAVSTAGDAAAYGAPVHERLAQPIVGMASTPDGKGYWLVAADGGVFSYGDAGFYGSTGNVRLNQPIVGMAPTSDGRGYWLVAADGGVFTFGDAGFHGSTGNIQLWQPVVGMTATPDGGGYWLVAADGGIFTFGNASFYGSMGATRLAQPVVGMARTDGGGGYWLVGADGGIFTFGNAGFWGSAVGRTGGHRVVGLTATLPLTGGGTPPTTTTTSPPPPSTTTSTTAPPTTTTSTTAPVPTTTAPPSTTTSTTTAPPGGNGLPYGTAALPFSATSPFNTPLPTGFSTAAAGQSSLAGQLAAGPAADVYEFGIPIFTDVNASTPRYTVPCTEPWGSCDFAGQQVPIPADAAPDAGSDADMVVIDPSTGRSYEFWQAKKGANGQWTTSWGAITSITGASPIDISGNGATTGSGMSILAGTVTLTDLTSGAINHALSFSSSLTCSTHVAPATGSDGHGTPPNCLPEGSRVALSSSVNLAAIPGITPLELMVGRALQTYGAYCRDTGGAPMAFGFQEPTATDNPYASLGLPWDYWNMPHIPWQDLIIVNG
jgi:hypothetical protein